MDKYINKVIQGNCLEVLKTLEENSIDSIVTDPPYELGFMGKFWDSTGIANNVELWKECLRVLKPGGHLLAFSGTRTYHRMASAIEDAGFEVRDMIEWVYGSGFPKSLNIGKAVDKLQGNEREQVGTYQHPDGKQRNWSEHISPKEAGSFEGGWDNNGRILDKGNSEWEGWGTALKPAHEPICMARKPLAEKTVAENVLKYGTGGINIDESRVDYNGEIPNIGGRANHTRGDGYGFKELGENIEANTQGRFPANLIHDNSEEVRECFPESISKQSPRKGQGFHNAFGRPDRERLDGEIQKGHNDSGNASRFFKSIIYQAKASKSERNKGLEDFEDKERVDYGGFHSEKGLIENNRNPENRLPTKNNHPTVKPIALMEYLIKMVTPKGGIVLDPFAGSGTTGVACKNLNRNYILIEKEPEYIEIINKRLNNDNK